MSTKIVFRRIAQAEFAESAQWYEQQTGGFG